jgi:uncharacterized protein
MPDNAKTPIEPSMEEIIASISRIITEDKRPIETVSPASEKRNDILELTDVVNEDGSVCRVTPSAENMSASSAGSTAATDSSAPNATMRSAAGVEPRLDLSRERILSSTTSGAAAAAFAQLGVLPRDRRRDSELKLGSAGRTLEEIVRDLLRPLLKTWLDEYLPDIVERLVREEIARVVGEAGLR